MIFPISEKKPIFRTPEKLNSYESVCLKPRAQAYPPLQRTKADRLSLLTEV